MTVSQLLSTIVRGVRADLGQCEALLPLLEVQQQALAAADSEKLAAVGTDITVALNGLESSARSRTECLEKLGLKGDMQGMRSLISKLPEALGAELQTLWQELKTSIARCQALNERNGELLASQRMTLAHLTGQNLSGYGPDPG